jgi:hypothetical protein
MLATSAPVDMATAPDARRSGGTRGTSVGQDQEMKGVAGEGFRVPTQRRVY